MKRSVAFLIFILVSSGFAQVSELTIGNDISTKRLMEHFGVMSWSFDYLAAPNEDYSARVIRYVRNDLDAPFDSEYLMSAVSTQESNAQPQALSLLLSDTPNGLAISLKLADTLYSMVAEQSTLPSSSTTWTGDSITKLDPSFTSTELAPSFSSDEGCDEYLLVSNYKAEMIDGAPYTIATDNPEDMLEFISLSLCQD